jgi:uncharacterized membrane protein YphA (DoxX/SURF4 family)
MALTRRIARPLLASIFIVGGFDALSNPEGKTQKARAVTEPLQEHAPTAAGLETKTFVQINGAVQVAGGALLAFGRLRRLACIVLMGSLVPTTYAGHRFWEESDDAARAQQRIQFAKNLGLLGGLILALVDTEGSPSLSWRAKRRLHGAESGLGSLNLGSKAKAAATNVSNVTATASASSRRAARRSRRASRRLGSQVKDLGMSTAQHVMDGREGVHGIQTAAAEKARQSTDASAQVLQQTGALVAGAVRHLEPLAERAVQTGAERATEGLERLVERLPSS